MLGRLISRGSRGRFADIAGGQVASYRVDVETQPELAADLVRFAAGLPRRSAETRRLRVALEADCRDALLDQLAVRHTQERLLAVQLCGALELEAAVPWLELRLNDRKRVVREASARALGRIGGARAAEVLLRALPRERVAWFRLTVELAKAASALYLDSALADLTWHQQRPALMVALALRRRELPVSDFLAAASITGPRDLVAACHVLARAPGATAWVAALLDHPDRRVRAAADRALRRLRNAGARPVYVVSGASAS